ncbi:MAG: DUF2121 domain-containing protein [Methanobacterium sp.]|uniref:MJ0548 connectase family domain-containing protein n=1 Tax=Methanobacterium sp. TaxID=2164 RepID=UPI003D661D9D|nr:DUF2121 domain-containing protein [Methanobacterium sp.]
MSLIISYIGSNGCVIAGDKRRIGFVGDKDNREKLEKYLYSGAIQTDDELIKVAKELEISIKISDDAQKVRSIDNNVVVGEVASKTPFEARRKRIYGATNGYIITELLGSNIDKMKDGDSSIIVFGNKITKKMANEYLQEHWKSKLNLNDVSTIFQKVLEEVSAKTPSVSKEFDIVTKHSNLDKKEAQKVLRETIVEDVKRLQKWREELKEQQMNVSKTMELASKIVNEGIIGQIKSIEGNKLFVTLNNNIQAFDVQWNMVAGPGDLIEMNTDDSSSLNVGDMAVIQNENLCIARTKSPIQCDVILCKIE